MLIRRISLLGILILGALTLSACCTPPTGEALNVTLAAQQRDWWCWAATTQMISDFEATRVAQCRSANQVHGTPPTCCTGCTGDCPCWGSGWGATIAEIKDNWDHWDYDYVHLSSELSWTKLKKAISTRPNCDKSPVQAVWWRYDGAGNVVGGHVVTVYGYLELRLAAQNLRLVFYHDPWPPSCDPPITATDVCSPTTGGGTFVSTYDAFLQTGNRIWGDTFYAFRHTGP
ncbi:MAG: hypothetical protein PVG82_03580 [Chromatiales bacterium]|jgi:hypothetical protein